MTTTVTVGGISCNNAPGGVVDEAGVVWTLDNLGGWFDSAPARVAPLIRPGVSGAVDADPLDDARVIVVDGRLDAPDEAALLRALRSVSLLLNNPRRGSLVVDEGSTGLTLSALVRREGRALATRDGQTGAVFQWTLYAPDPARYSAVSRSVLLTPYTPGGGFTFPFTFPFTFGGIGSSGFATVQNGGVTPAAPVIRITGPCTNPVIRLAGGAYLKVLVTLGAAEAVLIDGRGPLVTRGGASARHLLSAGSSFFLLPPGASTLFFDTDEDTGSAVVEWREAY